MCTRIKFLIFAGMLVKKRNRFCTRCIYFYRFLNLNFYEMFLTPLRLIVLSDNYHLQFIKLYNPWVLLLGSEFIAEVLVKVIIVHQR